MAEKKRKTWLWVLGWIFCFPVPLTILMLRNKKLPSIVRYVIIGVAWAVYLLMLAAGGCNNKKTDTTVEESPAQEQVVQEEEPAAVGKVYELSASELGEYGRVIVLNSETDMPVEKYLYKLPAGKYRVTTTNDKMSSFFIVKDDITIEEGNDEYPEILDYVTPEGFLLTAGDNDFGGKAKKEVLIELSPDENIQIPTNDTGVIVFEEVIE